ncbi:serine hydrolase [Lacipirellula sp.]|uniref:serine hydrolase n=1 Tax=Lacipirellula sp. TaxID=2691419 RepID=UPI003D141A4E
MLPSSMKTLCVLPMALLLWISMGQGDEPAQHFDVLITGGRVVDGTGAPWYRADVGVRDGRIAAIGRLEGAKGRETIDATGLIVAPGFIDMMGQTANPMFDDPKTSLNLLTQGITTINAGEGDSAAPLSDKEAAEMGRQTMAEYFLALEQKGLPLNVVQTVGLTQIRTIVIGEEDRRPSDEELAQMEAMVREAMEAGAIGVSTALIYPPAVYATTKEIAALAKVAGQYGGRYYTHMRNEGARLLEAIDEAIDVGETAGTPVHIYHLKAAGRANWGKMPLAIARIKAARAAGMQIAADVYPYQMNGLGLEAFIHPRHFAKGREQLLSQLDKKELRAEIRAEMEGEGEWENWYRHVGKDWNRVLIGNCADAKYARLGGESVAAIAKEMKQDPWDTFFDLVQAQSFALPQTMSDANIIAAMQEDFISYCTDVGPAGESRSVSHPRAAGAFPRVLARYVRDLGVISLEKAVSQASAVAANEVMAYDRGRIAEGLAADLVLFDAAEIQDHSTPAEPRKLSTGMKHVLVNGTTVLKNGELTDKRPGRVLRGPGYQRSRAPHAVATGKVGPGLEPIDRVMRRFMERHPVPGAAVAITDGGRLVYARGYGYADVAKREAVEPESLFRIASISKPLTATAVMQLVEQGKLDLDAKVYDILDEYEPYLAEGVEFDKRQRDITIRHCLQHRGGWDRDKSFDGMFQSARFAKAVGEKTPASHTAIIRCMLGTPLDFEPGERFAYSNYGYCLLGRVIEKITGQKYDDYVKEHVLAPVKVDRMAIGATLLEGRKDGEVRYYAPLRGRSLFSGDEQKTVPVAYGAWDLEAMDSHGAWIASAVDLVKFSSAFDEASECPLLEEQTIETMFARPPGLAGHDKEGKELPGFYSAGWRVECDKDGKLASVGHGGSLDGTNTKMVRRADGRNFAVLFNGRQTPTTDRVAEAASAELMRAIDAVEEWPRVDYFEAKLEPAAGAGE